MVTKKKHPIENLPDLVKWESTDLRKAVEAIAVTPHAGKLTLLTRKLSNVFLAEAQAQGIHEPIYRMSLSKVCAKAHYDSTNMVLIKDQLRKMASTTVEWNVGVKGSRRWGVTALIEVEVIEEGNRCSVEWSYPTKLKEKLLAPDVYARISLAMQNSFRSAAALALYEICVRYADSPAHLTMRLPWETWRPMLTGVPDGDKDATYLEYKYFKRDVLKPSVAEINGLATIDIEVEMVEYKNGRSVSDIQFKVYPKKQAGLAFDEPNLFDLSLITRIVALGFTQGQAEKIYGDHEESKVRAALDYTENRQKRQPPLDKPQGYFRDALSKGYGAKAVGQIEGEKHKAIEMKKEQGRAPASAQTEGNITQHLAEAWLAEQRKIVREAFDGSSPAEQSRALKEFEASEFLKPAIRAKWRKDGLSNPLCAASFSQWLMRDAQAPDAVALLQYGLAKGLLSTKT